MARIARGRRGSSALNYAMIVAVAVLATLAGLDASRQGLEGAADRAGRMVGPALGPADGAGPTPTPDGRPTVRVGRVILPEDRLYTSGDDVLRFTLTFTDEVVPSSAIGLGLDVGGENLVARPQTTAGGATRSITFEAPLHSDLYDADGITLRPLIENYAQLRDLSGRPVHPVLPRHDTSGIQVDTRRNRIIAVEVVNPLDVYRVGDTLQLKVRFLRPVSVKGTTTLPLELDGPQPAVINLAPKAWDEDSITYERLFDAATPLCDTDGPRLGPALEGAGEPILNVDVVARPDPVDLSLSHLDASAVAALRIDTCPPQLVGWTHSPGDRVELHPGDTLTIELAFDDEITVTGSPSIPLALDSGGTPRAVLLGSAGRIARFGYTVGDGDRDPDGLGFANAVSGLHGGAITDSHDNTAQIDFTPFTQQLRQVTVAPVSVQGVGLDPGGNPLIAMGPFFPGNAVFGRLPANPGSTFTLRDAGALQGQVTLTPDGYLAGRLQPVVQPGIHKLQVQRRDPGDTTWDLSVELTVRNDGLAGQ